MTLHILGVQLESAANKIKRSIDEIQNLLNQLTGKNVDIAGDYIDDYAIYR